MEIVSNDNHDKVFNNRKHDNSDNENSGNNNSNDCLCHQGTRCLEAELGSLALAGNILRDGRSTRLYQLMVSSPEGALQPLWSSNYC